MPILGSQVTKIEATRGEMERELKIKSNVELIDVSKKPVNVADESRKMLHFKYRFTVSYSEQTSIQIEGVVYFSDEDKVMDEFEAKWNKDKKLKVGTVLPILNHAMELGYVHAISVAEKLKLPTPLKMPKFVPGDKK